MRGTRRGWLVVGVLLFALSVAPPAGADVCVDMSGTTLRVITCGESSRQTSILVEHFGDSTRDGTRVRQFFVLTHPTITTGSPGCTHNPILNDVVCTPFPSRGEVITGDEDDLVAVGGSNLACVSTSGTPFEVELRGGDDILGPWDDCGGMPGGRGDAIDRLEPIFTSASGGPGADRLTGGGLNDELFGDAGSDLLRGNIGNDRLFGGTNGDTLEGMEGNDTLDGQGGADTMNGGGELGGGGIDTATYAARGSAVTVRLDGTANDGAAGEGDNLIAIDKVLGGAGNDDLRGNDGANTLEGRNGDDELEGLDGTDVLSGQAGDDLIDSRDGVAETVFCGAGFDTVVADSQDTVLLSSQFFPAACESVTRSPIDDGSPGRVLGRSVRIQRDGTVRLRLKCPRRARVACRGRLRLTTAGRRRRTLGAARYRVPLRRTRAVQLRVSRRAVARARRAKVLIAATKERGASKKGLLRDSAISLHVRR